MPRCDAGQEVRLDEMEYPLISIIVPVRNDAGNLERCVRSLKSIDYPTDRYEIIVVDAHSTDGTPEVARKNGAIVILDDGKGRASALNLGVAQASGEYVAFTDADCSPERDWMKNLLKRFTLPDIAGVGGPNIVPKDESPFTRAIEYVAFQSPYAEVFNSEGDVATLAGCNALYRASVLAKIMPLPEIRDYEDAILNHRITNAGFRLVSAPDAVVWHYRHYSDPTSFFRKMVLLGSGEVNGVRIERGLGKWAHKVAGFSIPLLMAISFVLFLLGNMLLVAFLLFLVIFLTSLTLKCLFETKSIRVAMYVPLVTVIEGLGYSVGYLRATISRRGV